MPTRVKISRIITIDAPQARVFAYISNIGLDPHWRPEVDEMDVQGEIAIGTLAVEYSTLFGGLMKTVTPTRIVALDEPDLVKFETPPDHPSWLSSSRYSKRLSDKKTEVLYILEFDIALGGFTGSVMGKCLEQLYAPRIPKYLNLLKGLLERNETEGAASRS